MVEIATWSDYNPRADRGNFAWFRMDNQFYLNMRVRKKASGDATVLFAFLLAECSTRNGAPFKLSVAFAADVLGRTEKKIEAALHELVQMGDCVLKRLEAASCLTNERTNERTNDEPPTAPRPSFDFEKIYTVYPRKEGKKRGLEICARQIKTQSDFDKLLGAVARYCSKLRADGTEPKFVKHFDTFMGSWTDWVDPSAGQTRIPPPPNERKYFDQRPPEVDIPADPDAPAKIAAIMKNAFRSMPIPKGEDHGRDS